MHSETTRLAGFILDLIFRLCFSSGIMWVFSLLNITLPGSYGWNVVILTIAGYAAIGLSSQWKKGGNW